MQAPPIDAPFADKMAYYRTQHMSKGVNVTHQIGTPIIAFGLLLLFAKPRLRAGVRYWSVVNERFELVAMFDGFLFEERVSRDRSEKTTGQYASNLVEFASWARDRDLLGDLVACARNLGMFQLHLRTSRSSGVVAVTGGPGATTVSATS